MLLEEQEGRWFVDLSTEQKAFFLAKLGHQLTVVARNSYQAQTENLEKPTQLRQVNEIQHRVLACLSQILAGDCETSFQESMASFVLQQSDGELGELTHWAWLETKQRISQ